MRGFAFSFHRTSRAGLIHDPLRFALATLVTVSRRAKLPAAERVADSETARR